MPAKTKVTFVNGPLDGKTDLIDAWIDKVSWKHEDGQHYVYRRNLGNFELMGKTDDPSAIEDMNPQVGMLRMMDFVTDLIRETDMLREQLAQERAKPLLEPGLTFTLPDGKVIVVKSIEGKVVEVEAA